MANWILNWYLTPNQILLHPSNGWDIQHPWTIPKYGVVLPTSEYQVSGGQSLFLRQTCVCFLGLLKIVMPANFWILAPTPSSKLEMQSSSRISPSRINVYRLKIYLKMLKSLLHQMNQSLQKQKVLMLKKKLQKL